MANTDRQTVDFNTNVSCHKFKNHITLSRSRMDMLAHQLGFTLAEVLITLGIIGVVAALTIPTLINNSQTTQFKTAWKKAYSSFAQTFLILQSDGGADWTPSTNAMRDSFEPYFKTLKKCDASGDDCWHSGATIKNITSTAMMPDYSSFPGIVTVDGMKIIFYSSNVAAGWVMVDVNGDKKPNVLGRDIYGLRLDQNTRTASAFTEAAWGTCNPPVVGLEGVGHLGLGCSEYYLLH